MSTILFTKPDDPQAAALLKTLLAKTGLPILGLIVKVNQDDKVINVELTDENTVKALALAAALEEKN
jgi:hypothetical protein